MRGGLSLALTRAGGVRASAEFARDTFTDVAGTLLQDHTPELGGPWVKISSTPLGSVSGAAVITADGRVRRSATSPYLLLTADSLGANVSVSADLFVASITTSYPGILARASWTTTLTCYKLVYEANLRWRLYRVIANIEAALGLSNDIPDVGTTRHIELRCVGSSIKVFIDGVERISVIDATIPNLGRVGLMFNSAASTDTTSRHIDNLSAVNL